MAQTTDWPKSTEPVLTEFPRSLARDGGKDGPDEVVKKDSARWTTKYGSIVTTVYGIGAVDVFKMSRGAEQIPSWINPYHD